MPTLHNILHDRSNSYQRDSRIVAGLENFEISQSRRSCRRFQRLFILLSREIFLLCNSLRFFLLREFRLSPFSLFRERERVSLPVSKELRNLRRTLERSIVADLQSANFSTIQYDPAPSQVSNFFPPKPRTDGSSSFSLV